MTLPPGADRRRHPRRPKLMRFILEWQRSKEKVFTTDVSLCGVFVRTAVVPPLGSEVVIVLPEPRPADECIRLVGRVVRVVRRGDPYNPLGGVALELLEMVSPRGSGVAQELLETLIGCRKLTIPPVSGEVRIALPACTIIRETVPAPYEAGFDTRREPTRTMAVELAVFCRWRNMIIQASLKRLGQAQAILSGLKVIPEPGDEVSVRLLGISDSRFRGLQFTGHVDQLMTLAPGHTLVSLALDPFDEQPELGVLRQFLRTLDAEHCIDPE